MAAPHVAGVAALLYDYGITSPNQIKEIICESTSYPNGLLDAYEALYFAGSEYNDLIKGIRVFAATKIDNTYYVMSDITGADSLQNYELNRVKTNDWLNIFAWIDVNENGIIDTGDFFGKYHSEIRLSNGEHRSGIDFNIGDPSTASTMTNENMKVLFEAPPVNNEKGEE